MLVEVPGADGGPLKCNYRAEHKKPRNSDDPRPQLARTEKEQRACRDHRKRKPVAGEGAVENEADDHDDREPPDRR